MKTLMLSCAATLAIVLQATFAASADPVPVRTVRVGTSNGVPQIQMDGQPVRSRIFFGIPGSRPLTVGPAGRFISFEFSPTETELKRATMHLRFGQAPGDIYIDDITVVDLSEPERPVLRCDFEQADQFARQWNAWPPTNSVSKISHAAEAGPHKSACLRIQLTSPTRGGWPDFHIYPHPNLCLKQGHRYRVSLWVRATPERSLTIAFYRPGDVFTFLGGTPSCFESQIELAADVGVNLVSFPVHMPWPRDGKPTDWSRVERQCQTVLNANPQALLIPRIGLSAPRWWQEAHPECVMVWDQGPQKRTDVVVASPRYLQDASARLEALIRHLEEKFGARMAGYHPCGQNTGEWFYQETWGGPLNGYSQESRAAWLRWLQDKYVSDSQLQAAWRDESVTLQQADIPTPEARRAAPTGVLHDPIQARALLDFAEFQQKMMANCVCHFARTARQASAGNKLVVFFYGYVHEFGAIRNGPAVSGHYALRQVLDCPDIDILCSPISYFDRGLGQSGPAMTAAESVALAGKMWLVEDDTRTYLGSGAFPGWQDGVKTIEDTNKLLVRNTAQCAVRNFGTWWMDLGATGWFDDPRMWKQMELLTALDQPLLEHPRPFQPEVAVVVDPQSMLQVAAGGEAVTRPCVYEVRQPMGRLGAPYGQYLLDDVLAGKVPAKLYVFTNCWSLSPEQRRQLLRVTEGATKIWCYAPGYYEPQGPSLEAMQELTGFQCHRASVPHALAQPTAAAGHLGVSQQLGSNRAISPLFAVSDTQPSETIAQYADGTIAVAIRDLATGPSLFVGPPGLTSELVRLAARRAGVHLFTDVDCNVYANGPFLVLHASQDGELRLDTGHAGPVRELLLAPDLGTEDLGTGPHISLQLKKGDSRVLQLLEN